MTSRLEEQLRDLERDHGDALLCEALLRYMSHRGHGTAELLDRLAGVWTVRESELLDAAACIAARHRALEGDETLLRSLLVLLAQRSDLVRQLGGNPRDVLDEVGQTVMAQARLQGEAVHTIWREPMLQPRHVAVALGAKETNREKVRQLRERSWLLGLPVGRGYVYPAFQFDRERRGIFHEVRTVNKLLGAAGDPWGVASWWISTHARLGARPVELVGTERSDDLAAVAKAAAELVG